MDYIGNGIARSLPVLRIFLRRFFGIRCRKKHKVSEKEKCVDFFCLKWYNYIVFLIKYAYKREERNMKKIKIMSFNMRTQGEADGINRFRRRKYRILAMLDREEPDVIEFREVTNEMRAWIRSVLL